MERTWIEISKSALEHNLRLFRRIIGKSKILAPAIKGNAYGHGLLTCAPVFAKHADYLCVDSLEEAQALRKAGIKKPILILGYVPLSGLALALRLKCELTVYNPETIHALGNLKKTVALHLKIETGTHRQGVSLEDLPDLLKILGSYPLLRLKGISTHFANLEDTANFDYAKKQLGIFHQALQKIKKEGFEPEYIHAANTMATMFLKEARFNFVRTGIGNYGLLPSPKARQKLSHGKMTPALTWKTLVAQVKALKKNDLVGYGCTHKMPRNGKIAVIPVGYYDGYPRVLGNRAQILIGGQKVPVIGRICMNMLMADVSRVKNVKPEDEVVLLGRQGKEEISADDLAVWSETINYEVTTRINERIPRILVK